MQNRRLAWAATVDGDETGSSAYHGWVITPSQNDCHLLTGETQQCQFFVELSAAGIQARSIAVTQGCVKFLGRAAEAEVERR
ncbi:hypothetical protein [Paraburkholderia youngii]|uniref:hypothetical protein n=1 Tax=Paraburkholderia youngii TaxID=2782701 RepID=UPI003D215AC6